MKPKKMWKKVHLTSPNDELLRLLCTCISPKQKRDQKGFWTCLLTKNRAQPTPNCIWSYLEGTFRIWRMMSCNSIKLRPAPFLVWIRFTVVVTFANVTSCAVWCDTQSVVTEFLDDEKSGWTTSEFAFPLNIGTETLLADRSSATRPAIALPKAQSKFILQTVDDQNCRKLVCMWFPDFLQMPLRHYNCTPLPLLLDR